MRTPEIVSVGEAIIDFVSSTPAKDLASAKRFIKAAGGAPANVAVGLARLGIRSAFLGKVGKDSFGRFLKTELRRHGVQTEWIVEDPEHKTRLAFVAVNRNGDRDFEFWEKDPADEHLSMDEIDVEAVCGSSIINIGPFLLLNGGTKKSAFAIAAAAKRKKKWICFDPNVRMSLWKDPETAIQVYRSMIRKTTILRLNEDEAALLTGTKNLKNAVDAFLSMGPLLVVVTRGKKGCTFATKSHVGNVKGFSVKPIDTTGCGDGFLAGLLAGLIRTKKQINDLTADDLAAICKNANAVGAIVATRRGAIAAMPSQSQLNQFLRRNQ